MRINLNVPYSDKDKAKTLGAKWDAHKETWYVVNPENIFDFVQWAPERLKKATTSGPLKHPPFVVVQERTPKLKSKRRR